MRPTRSKISDVLAARPSACDNTGKLLSLRVAMVSSPFAKSRFQQSSKTSLDQFISAKHQARWNGVAHCLRGLEIDRKLEGRRLLDRQFSGLCSTQDLGQHSRALAKGVKEARAIAQQSALIRRLRPLVDRRQPKLSRTFDDGTAIEVKHR